MATTGDSWAKLKETRQRLEKCWEVDINWSLYPSSLKEVCTKQHFCFTCTAVCSYNYLNHADLGMPSSGQSTQFAPLCCSVWLHDPW